MREFKFSYLPTWAKNTHDAIDVWLRFGDSGYEFRCEEGDADCTHPISQEQVPQFLISLGQDPNEELIPALERLVTEGGASAIHAAIHKTLKASFVWRSTDWS